jgi:alpha-tubulin suppressor-like RCC1 family protein
VGQIGTGRGASTTTPTLVTSALTFDTTAGSLSVGGTHVCGITTPARIVHCWGDDGSGQLGTQVVTVNSTTPVPAELPPTPSTLAARWVSAGYRHSCAVARTGEAFCWGSNASGEIGNGTQGGTATVPTPVAGAFAYRTISASPIALRPNGGTANTDDNEAHTCALTTEGNAVCWGANASGQTGGSPGVRYVTTPTRIESGLSFADISTGGGFTCAVDTNRAVYCWGRNDLGQLGTGAPGSPTRGPTRVAGAVAVDESGRVVGIPGVQYVSVTAGRRHACAVSTGGEVYCWGSDVVGALGTPVQAPVQAVPTRVAKPL